MNHQNPKINRVKKYLLTTTAVLASCLSLFFVFHSNLAQSQTLPDCKYFVGTVEPGNNCLFYGLKLCQTIPSSAYNIPASSIVSATPENRVNCANLSDLPLCSQMDGVANPIKDCVKECSDASFDGGTGVRGQDFAVHNRDCVRFCDAPEAGVTINVGINCVGRKCHQLGNDALGVPIAPNPPTNCNTLRCNLLTPDELNEAKFNDASKKYCDGTGLKCLNFTQAQLPFVKIRPVNATCEVHNCRTESETCVPYANDDVQKILDKGTSYVDDYKTYVNAGYEVTAKAICKQIVCKPVVYRQYRCLPLADANPTQPNTPNCDTDMNCPGGYCKKKIDCNLAGNSGEPECAIFPGSTYNPSADTNNGWFYRPTPPGGSVDGSANIRPMGNFCYTMGQMDDYDWLVEVDLLFETLYLSWDNHPLGACGADDLGTRGYGYIYLCGTEGLLYNLPNKNEVMEGNIRTGETAFQKGYAKTTYTEDEGVHEMEVCARYNNAMDPQRSCGKRECMIVCIFAESSGDCTNHCGYDVCKTLKVKDSDPTECAIEDNFSSNPSRDCMKTIDTYVRLRAVKYGNYLCSFLDLKGTLAYNAQYFDGSEKLANGTCISGYNVEGSCDGGKNTNSTPGLADLWRTVMMVPYIQNNRTSGPRGYLDKEGRLFEEQQCPKVAYRVQTPRTFNLANINNSPALFSPPLYILNSRIKRGGAISGGSTGPGPTDFHYPEIEVKFGSTSQLLSLGINYSGHEISSGDPQGKATITTTLHGFDYSMNVFVRKEETVDANPPAATFCLYREVQDENGAILEPLRIGCVKRQMPEIDNTSLKAITPAIDLRKLVIYPDSANTYDDPKIGLRYLSSSNINSVNCSSGGANCTTELLMSNEDPQVPSCDNLVERHKVCAQREECSALNIECMTNEISLNNAANAGQPIDSFLAVRRNCNEILLPLCNSKKGISSGSLGNILEDNFNAPPSDPNVYGWFNEICVSAGFETKLKDVVAYQISNGRKGKCDIDPASPYLTDGNPATNCDSGGKAPNCLCVTAVYGIEPNPGFEVRMQTNREAGLCVDTPLPQNCPAIDYNTSPNPDQNDVDYVGTSLNNIVYGTSTTDIVNKVHISHKYRTEGKLAPNAIPLKGHAEFPKTVFGVNDVNGECKGFWTYRKSASSFTLRPKLNCVDNGGIAEWEADARDACVRYQCNEVFTSGPDENGLYQGGYGITEIGEDKGLSNGFALWPSYTKTNDFLESVSADSCITGFKKSGSLAFTASGTVTGQNAINASLNGLITGYSGGTSATRQCNQLGQYLPPSNVCQRIACPAVNPPASPSTPAEWALWQNSSGATFPSVNASRSTLRIQAESIASGTCNQALGFFRNPGGQNPIRKCDSLGNWLPAENPCTTTCDPVTTDATAASFNNGYAKWGVTRKKITLYEHCGYGGWAVELDVGSYPTIPAQLNLTSSIRFSGGVRIKMYSAQNYGGAERVITSSIGCFVDLGLNDAMRSLKIESINGDSIIADFAGCVPGYITNPYPPFQDMNGNPLSPAVANDLTRPAEDPKRVCVVQDSGAGFLSSVWGSVVNGCINQCPGADVDTRVGVGITNHTTSTGNISFSWPSTPFGEDAYMSNFNDNLDASYFFNGRTNTYYLVKRRCNANGTWSAPQVMCAANNGQMDNSKYDLNSGISGYADSIEAGSSTTITGSCASAAFWKYNYNTGSFPQKKCFFAAGNNHIDKVYLDFVNSTHDCEPVRCPAYVATKTDRASFPAVAFNDNRTAINGQIIGTCLNNTTNNAGTTVYTTLASGTLAPYIQCQANGTWSAIIGNGNCKHGCDFNGWHWRVNHGGCGDGMFYAYNYLWWDDGPVYGGFNFKHGQKLVFGSTDDCDGWCDALTLAFYCDDGNPRTRSIWGNNPAQWQCKFYNYNETTDSFDGGYNVNHGSWKYTPMGEGYTDKYNVGRSLSIAVWD
jgi:hypothetical protein